MRRLFLALIIGLICSNSSVYAKENNNAVIGNIQFKIPDAWEIMDQDDGFYFRSSSDKVRGFLAVFEETIDEIKQDANEGLELELEWHDGEINNCKYSQTEYWQDNKFYRIYIYQASETSSVAGFCEHEEDTPDSEYVQEEYMMQSVSGNFDKMEDVIFEKEGLKIILDGIFTEGDVCRARFIAENNSSKKLNVEIETYSLCGLMMNKGISGSGCNITPGKKAMMSIEVPVSTLESIGLETIDNLNLLISVAEGYRIIYRSGVLHIGSYDNEREYVGDVVYENNAIAVKKNRVGEGNIAIIVSNKSDWIMDARVIDVYVNDWLYSNYIYGLDQRVFPECELWIQFDFDMSKLRDIGVDNIDHVSLTVEGKELLGANEVSTGELTFNK